MAAAVLGMSARQVQRLLRRFRIEGAAAIRHKARGRRSNNRVHDGVRDYALILIRESYADFGPTLAAEKLAERHGLVVSRETVRTWMIADGYGGSCGVQTDPPASPDGGLRRGPVRGTTPRSLRQDRRIFMSRADLPHLDRWLRTKKGMAFLAKAILYPRDYEAVIEPFASNGYLVAPLRDVFGDAKLHGRKVFVLRHDVDHDFETALRMAEWERARGYSATYCVLHTAWYYGQLKGDRYEHFAEFVDFCLRLQELGHEVNLHNNFATVALETGVDAETLLGNELAALRGYGVDIVGTSSHGDKLCRELDFFNLEIFKDRAWLSKGGPRTVSAELGSIALGTIDMAAHGLGYEAYDYPRDVYASDSGGRPRVRRRTRGIRGLRRAELDFEVPFPFLCGALTHPVWWDFKRTDAPASLFPRAYAEAGLDAATLADEERAAENQYAGPSA